MTKIEFYKKKNQKIKITSRKVILSSMILSYLSPKSSILDLGCGDSYISYIARLFSKSVTAIDLAPNYMFEKVDYIEGDIFESMPDNKYDVVLALDILEHLGESRQKAKVIEDRIKEGGLLIINLPDSQDKSQPEDKLFTPIEAINVFHKLELIRLEKLKFTSNESYNFMVFKK